MSQSNDPLAPGPSATSSVGVPSGSYVPPGPSRSESFTETKLGVRTSEFALTVVFVLAVLVAAYLDDDTLGREDGWRFAAWAVVAYVISRGLAKLGVREPEHGARR